MALIMTSIQFPTEQLVLLLGYLKYIKYVHVYDGAKIKPFLANGSLSSLAIIYFQPEISIMAGKPEDN